MSASQPSEIKKLFLYTLIGSVLLSAVLGILAILSGSWGWLQVRILLTTVIISGASICGLACAAYLATNGGRVLPAIGIVLALAGAATLIAGMWIDVGSAGYWKVAASVSVFAVACGHLALLSMARLADWFWWSLVVAYVVIFGVASLIVALIWIEPDGSGVFKLVGVAAIVDAAVTIVIPIFHWLSRPDLNVEKQSIRPMSPDSPDAVVARLKKRIAELERKTKALEEALQASAAKRS
jgi:hypothetical protein